MQKPTFDKDGYPTEETLRTIREWKLSNKNADELLCFIAEAWHYEDRAQNVRPGIWTFSTGGWSGNEELLAALYKSLPWFLLCWSSIKLSGGFLCIATTPEAIAELEWVHDAIVKWAWNEKQSKLVVPS